MNQDDEGDGGWYSTVTGDGEGDGSTYWSSRDPFGGGDGVGQGNSPRPHYGDGFGDGREYNIGNLDRRRHKTLTHLYHVLYWLTFVYSVIAVGQFIRWLLEQLT